MKWKDNYKLKNFHSSLIHNSLQLETTEMSTYRKMDKHILGCSQSPTTERPNNIGESQNHCVNWKKLDINEYILYGFYEVQEKAKLSYSDRIQTIVGWKGRQTVWGRTWENFLRSMEMFWVLFWMMVTVGGGGRQLSIVLEQTLLRLVPITECLIIFQVKKKTVNRSPREECLMLREQQVHRGAEVHCGILKMRRRKWWGLGQEGRSVVCSLLQLLFNLPSNRFLFWYH